MKLKLGAQILLVGAAMVFCTSVGSADSDFMRRYRLPVAEVENVIRAWLKRNGFDVHRSTLPMRRAKIEAVNQEQSWSMILAPHSPLATDVELAMTPCVAFVCQSRKWRM